MKRTIKMIGALVLGAMMMTGCQKEEVSGLVTLNAEISGYNGANGKVYVDAERYTHWNDGDKVMVNNSVKTVSIVDGRAQIAGVDPSDNGYTAIYGAALNEVQAYVEDGSGNQKVNSRMAAYCGSGESTLRFQNLCSLLKVTVKAPAADICMERIIVTSDCSPLWGSTQIYKPTDGPFELQFTGYRSGHTVTLDFGASGPTITSGNTKTFYVVVPAIVEASTITVDVQARGMGDGANKYQWRRASQSPATLAANMIAPVKDGANDFVQPASTGKKWFGEGTAGDPYLINSLADLISLRIAVNGGSNQSGKYFKLMADIDASGSNWTPIGPWPNTFSGTFDGNGHNVDYTITDAPEYSGLFARVYNHGTVKNLKVSGSITGSHGYCGGVAGNVSTNSTITNCYSSVNITNTSSYVGGIVGNAPNYATISYCAASGSINNTGGSSAWYLGGIVGYCYNTGSKIQNCTFTGSLICPDVNQRGMISGGKGGGGGSASGCHYLSNSTNNPNGYLGVGTSTTPYSTDEGTISYATLSALKTAALSGLVRTVGVNDVYYDYINGLSD